MLKEEQTIAIPNVDTDTAMAIAYEAFQNLNWIPQFAGPEKLLGTTPKMKSAHGQEIIISVADSQLSISSEMVNNEVFDKSGKNKHNVAAFIEAYQNLAASISPETIEANKQTIHNLREETLRLAEEESREAAEIDAVMNLSKSNLNVTYAIIAINILVFMAMVVRGVPVFEPTGFDIINWGGNYGPLTVSGEWWRLFTCIFVHIGIIHIAFNMYALYTVGIYLEPLLGKVRYTVAYLCTGILASLASLWWHSSNPVTSAGASGAIFGIYGVFLALLSTSLIPKKIRGELLKSIGIFVVYNLVYGLKSGIDNSAHLGGLVSGLVIGYLFYLTLVKQLFTRNIAAVCAVIIATTLALGFGFIKNSKQVSAAELGKLRNEIKGANFKDAKKYISDYEQLITLQNEALAPLQDSTAKYDEALLQKLQTITLPKWKKAQAILQEMKRYEVPDHLKAKTRFFEKYIDQRLQEVELVQQIIKGNEQAKTSLETLNEAMNITVDSLQAQ